MTTKDIEESYCHGCHVQAGQQHKQGCPVTKGMFLVNPNEPQFNELTIQKLYETTKRCHVKFLILWFEDKDSVIRVKYKPAVQIRHKDFRVWGMD